MYMTGVLCTVCGAQVYYPDCKEILAYALLPSVCPFDVKILLTYVFKFWNLLCNLALPSLVVSCNAIGFMHN